MSLSYLESQREREPSRSHEGRCMYYNKGVLCTFKETLSDYESRETNHWYENPVTQNTILRNAYCWIENIWSSEPPHSTVSCLNRPKQRECNISLNLKLKALNSTAPTSGYKNLHISRIIDWTYWETHLSRFCLSEHSWNVFLGLHRSCRCSTKDSVLLRFPSSRSCNNSLWGE